jgi:hypothetical protein
VLALGDTDGLTDADGLTEALGLTLAEALSGALTKAKARRRDGCRLRRPGTRAGCEPVHDMTGTSVSTPNMGWAQTYVARRGARWCRFG